MEDGAFEGFRDADVFEMGSVMSWPKVMAVDGSGAGRTTREDMAVSEP